MSKSKLITLDLLDENLKAEITLIQDVKRRVETIETNGGTSHTHGNLQELSLITEDTIKKIDAIHTSSVGLEMPTTDVWYKKI